MGKDILTSATNVAELAMVCGLAYLGYKVAKDLGLIGKKDGDGGGGGGGGGGGNQPASPIDQVIQYVTSQPAEVIGTTDLSRLTPTVSTPIGPVGFGLPSIVSGAVGQGVNAVTQPIFKYLLFGTWDDRRITSHILQDQANRVQATRPSGAGGSGMTSPQPYRGTPYMPTTPQRPVQVNPALWSTSPRITSTAPANSNRLVVGPAPGQLPPWGANTGIAPPDVIVNRGPGLAPLISASWYNQNRTPAAPAAPTVVYNNSIGQRITLAQVAPEDRQNQVGQKTPEQQMAAYGALETRPVIPAPAAPATSSETYVWIDTNSRSLSTEPKAGWTKMTIQEALQRGY